jgi:GT2 family glycosyltransferase
LGAKVGERKDDEISETSTTTNRADEVLVSIVNYLTADLCIACLASLATERGGFAGFRVVVADGASNDRSSIRISEWIEAQGHQDWITFLPLSINGGFGWAHNQVILRAMSSVSPPAFIHFLNPDTIVEPGGIAALREAFENGPHIGCVGSQMINGQGGSQPAGFRLANVRTEFARGAHTDILVRLLSAKHPVIGAGDDRSEIEAVSGASFMVRTAALCRVGLFDTGFFLYSEEFEWMKRFRADGWKIAHEPNSRVHHVGGAATKLSRDREVLARSARPFYWYQSQRRYLYRTLGTTRARLAGLAWFVGYLLIAWPRAFLSRDFRSQMVKNEGRDMLRAWLTSDCFDRQAFIPFPGDPIDEPPAWMTRQ